MKGKPIKTTVPVEFDFVKAFVHKGLYMNGVNFSSTEVRDSKTEMCYMLNDNGLYSIMSVTNGKFEAWARNQGAFEAARKEGFTDEQISRLDIYMGLPIWLQLTAPEDVIDFLSKKDFSLYSPTGKVLRCVTRKEEKKN